MHFIDALGALVVLSSLCFVWPQVFRLIRTRDASGVSALGALWALAGFGLWTVYGADTHLGAVTIANAQSVAGFLVAAVLARRFGPAVPRFVPALLAIASGVVAAAVLLPAEAVGWTAVAVGATAYLPQARVALARDGSALGGVSITTYVLIAVSSALWASYGVFEHDVIVVAPNVVIIPTAALIALRALRHRASLVERAAGAAPQTAGAAHGRAGAAELAGLELASDASRVA